MSKVLTPEQEKLLHGPSFAHVATVNKDGSPQVSPVWIDYDGTHIIFNTETSRLKPKNLKRDPRIAMSIQDPGNPYHYIHIRGRVVELTEQGAFEHIDKLSKKYFGQDTYPYNQPGDRRVIVKVEPERIFQMG